MVRRDEPHLFCEWEVEKEDTTVRAIASLIVNVAIRTNAPPRMPAVYFIELLIHMGRYEKWQLNRVCHKEAQKAQKLFAAWLDRYSTSAYPLNWEKPHDLHSDTKR